MRHSQKHATVLRCPNQIAPHNAAFVAYYGPLRALFNYSPLPCAPCFSPLDGLWFPTGISEQSWRDDQIDVIMIPLPTVPRRQSVGEVWAPCHHHGCPGWWGLPTTLGWTRVLMSSIVSGVPPRSHYFTRECFILFLKCNLSGCLRKLMSLKSTIKLDVSGHSQCPSLSRYRYPNIVCRSLPDQIWSRTRRVCFGSCDIDILTLPHDWAGTRKQGISLTWENGLKVMRSYLTLCQVGSLSHCKTPRSWSDILVDLLVARLSVLCWFHLCALIFQTSLLAGVYFKADIQRDYIPNLGQRNRVLLKLQPNPMFSVAISVGYL